MKKEKPLTIGRLSLYSLRGKIFRTCSLTFVVFILAFTLFSGAILSASLQNGLSSLKERLGADIAVVPLGYESQYEGIILSSEPIRFYFDKSIEQQISKIEGVAQVTAQFYLSTLSADCCSVQVQIIGIDPETDFVTKPWISKSYSDELKDEQMIIGSDIWADKNGKLIFFNQEFSVVAKLEKTSTGMDNSVFVNMTTIRKLAKSATEIGIITNAAEQNAEIDNVISSVLVKTERGYELNEVSDNIRRTLHEVSLVKSKNILSSVSKNLGIMQSFINTFSVALWGLSALILTIMFSVTVNGRKKEFSILRILGASRKRLIQAVLTESAFVSVTGSLLGIMLSSTVIFSFSTYIGEQLGLPFLLPNIENIIIYLIVTFILSAVTGPLSSIYAALKISQAEAYVTLREGE